MEGHVRLWGLCLALALAAAPAPAQEDHAYSAEQIQAGYRLYASQCQLCHGQNGDSIAGTNLGRQQFRLVSTDARNAIPKKTPPAVIIERQNRIRMVLRANSKAFLKGS